MSLHGCIIIVSECCRGSNDRDCSNNRLNVPGP